jgi:hypothetical protein
MERIKIENPDRLIEIYKEIAPNWIMKFRGSSGQTYKFGLQSDSTKVWDEFQIYITKEMEVIHTENITPHYYVKLMVVEQLHKRSLTNVIRLDECRNPQKLIEHILDGMDAIVQS